MDELPCIPLGCIYRNTALRSDLTDRVTGMPAHKGYTDLDF